MLTPEQKTVASESGAKWHFACPEIPEGATTLLRYEVKGGQVQWEGRTVAADGTLLGEEWESLIDPDEFARDESEQRRRI